ncbi:MFS transporter [Desulfotignum balticum]|uniref:MFS transporter n=1 Tax=Desulfotignum balticum TaxID=115781 RepID=UPI0004044B83
MRNEESLSQAAADKLFTHDFVLVFVAFFLFQTAYMAMIPTLPVYFNKLGSNENEVGLLVGILGIAALVSRFFVGAILTVYSEKKVMLTGITLFAGSLLLLIVFRHFWPLFIVRIVQGIAFAAVHTAAFTYAMKTVSPSHQGQGLAYFTLSTYLAMGISAPSGISLANRYNFIVFFVTFACLCLCSFLLACMIKNRKKMDTSEQNFNSYFVHLIEWRIVVPAISAMIQMFIYGAVSAFFPLYALMCGVSNPGLFFSACALVTIMSRAFGGKILDIYNKETMIEVLILIMMAALILLSVSKNLPMFILVGLIYGTGMAFFMPASMLHAFEYSGASDGPAVATFNASYDIGMALGPAVMGLIIPITGYPIMFLCLAFICIIDLFYFQFCVRKHDSTNFL